MGVSTTGLDSFHIALYDEVAKTYGTPKKLAPSIELKTTPNVQTANQHADDMVVDTQSQEGQTDLELTVTGLTNALYAEILGKEIDGDGAVIGSGDDNPPYFALMFRSKKANGKYKHICYFKSKFSTPEESYKTKGDGIEYGTTSLKATCVNNEDGKKNKMLDEDDLNADKAALASWFTKVPEYVAPTPIP
ncbi:hypothetical protein FQ087_18690 [Sporosarcina sp. ANT_H38]|uniref:major tail protein n=1 Tax=Sporosarcina sp. ANT_H38 TaxID=2597358 RepID=UPI0011F3361A|nr:major tail protein [Sporosarcina sp. ANT_H38]KAA0944153.1 hypothetical protein FQ087_18690 [Sporosarcina sp. ANT_H38]